jgi:hypothetical protein
MALAGAKAAPVSKHVPTWVPGRNVWLEPDPSIANWGALLHPRLEANQQHTVQTIITIAIISTQPSSWCTHVGRNPTNLSPRASRHFRMQWGLDYGYELKRCQLSSLCPLPSPIPACTKLEAWRDNVDPRGSASAVCDARLYTRPPPLSAHQPG